MAKMPEHEKAPLLARIRGWFFAGLLVTAPLGLTIYVIWAMVGFVDNRVEALLPQDLKFILNFPGAGLVVAGVVIILIGALTANLAGITLIRIGESLVNRVPVARSVYGAIKQIMETVMASQSDAFREVVLIEYPRRGIWVIGFVTGSTRGEVQNISSEDLINIFVPTTPNPTSGFLLFMPKEDAIGLDMGVEEAVKLVVSGGIVTPDDPRAKRTKASLTSQAAKKTSRKRKADRKKTPKRAVRKKAPKKAGRKKTAKKAGRA